VRRGLQLPAARAVTCGVRRGAVREQRQQYGVRTLPVAAAQQPGRGGVLRFWRVGGAAHDGMHPLPGQHVGKNHRFFHRSRLGTAGYFTVRLPRFVEPNMRGVLPHNQQQPGRPHLLPARLLLSPVSVWREQLRVYHLRCWRRPVQRLQRCLSGPSMHQVPRRHGVGHARGGKQQRVHTVRRRHVRGLCTIAVYSLRAYFAFTSGCRGVLRAWELHHPKRSWVLRAMLAKFICVVSVLSDLLVVPAVIVQRCRPSNVLRRRRVL
jgi:hypothetical protein